MATSDEGQGMPGFGFRLQVHLASNVAGADDPELRAQAEAHRAALPPDVRAWVDELERDAGEPVLALTGRAEPAPMATIDVPLADIVRVRTPDGQRGYREGYLAGALYALELAERGLPIDEARQRCIDVVG